MKPGFDIVEYLRGPKGIIYTVQADDSRVTELDGFLSDPECQSAPEFHGLLGRLHDMVNRFGFRRDWFETEKYPTPLGYVRYPGTRLRIYCWYREHVVLLGGGGLKKSRKLQDTPSTERAFERMVSVSDRLYERLRDKEIIVTPKGFTGDLRFEEME